MGLLADTLKQIIKADLPRSQMFQELRATEHGAAVNDKIKEILSHMKEIHPVRYGRSFNDAGEIYGIPRVNNAAGDISSILNRGTSSINDLEEQLLVQSPDRLANMKFITPQQHNEIKRWNGSIYDEHSYYSPVYKAMHIQPHHVVTDSSVIGHEGAHLMDDLYKNTGGTAGRENPITEMFGNFMFEPKNSEQMGALGNTTSWKKLYYPTGRVQANYPKEIDAMITQTINRMVAKQPMITSRTSDILMRLKAFDERMKGKLNITDFYKSLLGLPATAGVGMARTGEENG